MVGRERDKRVTGVEREKHSPEPDAGLDPTNLKIMTSAKVNAEPTEPPRCPGVRFLTFGSPLYPPGPEQCLTCSRDSLNRYEFTDSNCSKPRSQCLDQYAARGGC